MADRPPDSDPDGAPSRAAVEGFVEQAAVLAAASGRRSRPLDEDALDEIAALIAELPEPVAASATGVEVARAEGDATGVRKRLFELGIVVVRYTVSVGLALVAEALGEQSASRPLSKSLRRAVRLSDGGWCELGRAVAAQLEPLLGQRPTAFDFLRRTALATLVQERNQFVHGGGSGDDAPALTLAVLRDAAELLGWPLRAVTSIDPPSYQQRMGVPLRAGVWRKLRKPVPATASEGLTYLVHHAGGEERWTAAGAWLPAHDRRLLLIDAPHKGGAPWRCFDPESAGDHDCPELDRAVRSLAGDDAAAPMAPSATPALVGRGQAVAIMRRAAELTRQGGIGVVVLTGPQGIGRGRMLHTVREAAAAFDIDRVVEAACLEQRRGVLRPLRRAVPAVAGLTEVSAALRQAAAGDVLRGSEALEAAVEAVEEALIDASMDEPILLLLDDAQWADEPTLSLLSMLTERATRQAQGRLLVIAAVRDEPQPPAALTAFIGQVERDVGPGATRLALEPLAGDESTKLLEGVAPLSAELRALLVDGAAGVPFYLVQSVLAWHETGSLQWRDGAWCPADDQVLDRPVPGLAEVVQARLSSSFEPGSEAARAAQQVLAAVGMSGGSLHLHQLQATMSALEVGPSLMEQALEVLVEAGLLVSRGALPEYGFAQPMVRVASLASLQQKPWVPRLRRALLGVLGESDSADEDAAFIAGGYAELGDDDAAVGWLRRAVEHALTMGLFRQAIDHAERWAELARDADGRFAAALCAADALLRSGDAKAARARHERASSEAAAATDLQLRARILAVRIGHALGDTSEAPDRSLVADADEHGDVRLALEARLALAALLRAQKGLELVEQAIERLAESALGDLRYRVWVLRFELLAETGSIDQPRCRAALEQARKAAEAQGSAWALLDADNDQALLHSAAGDQDRAIRMLEQVASEAKQRWFGRMHRNALVNIATCHWRAGRAEQAARAAEAAAKVGRKAGDWFVVGVGQSVRADALRQLGDLAGARAAIDEAVELKLRAADPNVAIALLRRAEVLKDCQEPEQAGAAAELALQRARSAGNEDHVARAGLWLGLHRLEHGGPGAEGGLAEMVRELECRRDSLRGPTRRLLERASTQLRLAHPTVDDPPSGR